MSKISKSIFVFVLVLFIGIIISPSWISVSHVELDECNKIEMSYNPNDLSGVRIALYESYYSSTDLRISESRGALYQMLTWMNATVNIINRTDIEYGALWAHELLVIPEGLGPRIESNIGDEGMQNIRDWLSLGGSYIGVRGSAAMAVTDSYFEGSNTTFALGLFNGTSIGMPEIGHQLITQVNVNQSCTSPDLSTMNESMAVLFRTGRYFVAESYQEMTVVARYEFNDKPAMITAPYGEGNIFLSSPHFEYEENTDRDGTEYRDRYDDPDSEWPFMLHICKWLLEDSPIVQNTTSWEYPDPVTETTTTTTSTSTTTTSASTTTTLTSTPTTTSTTTDSNESLPSPVAYEPLLLVGGIAAVALVIGVLLKKR